MGWTEQRASGVEEVERAAGSARGSKQQQAAKHTGGHGAGPNDVGKDNNAFAHSQGVTQQARLLHGAASQPDAMLVGAAASICRRQGQAADRASS